MSEESRRTQDRTPADMAADARIDRALDRLFASDRDPGPPPDLARRILAATAAIPQEPPPAAAPGPVRWLQRPRALAAAFALVAVVGFAAGWVEPMLIGDAQAVDVTPFLIGSDLEIDL